MPRITPKTNSEGNISGNEWEDGGVEQIETSDSVLGGPPEQNNQRHSPPNYAFKEIVSRLGYLYQRIEEIARDIPGTVRAATRTVQGIARLASLAQVLEGTDDETIVTPKTLQGKIDNIPAPPLPLPATTTRRGLIELLNNSEGRLGTDSERAVTAAVLLDALRNGSPFSAGTTFKGVVERLTQAEARLGIDTTRYLTAALLLDALRNGSPFQASETQRGVARRASTAKADAGTDTLDFITSALLKRRIDAALGNAPACRLSVNSGNTTIIYQYQIGRIIIGNVTGTGRSNLSWTRNVDLITFDPEDHSLGSISNSNGWTYLGGKNFFIAFVR